MSSTYCVIFTLALFGASCQAFGCGGLISSPISPCGGLLSSVGSPICESSLLSGVGASVIPGPCSTPCSTFARPRVIPQTCTTVHPVPPIVVEHPRIVPGAIGGGCLSAPIAGGCGTIGGGCLSTPIAGGCGTIGGGCLSAPITGGCGTIGGGCVSAPITGGCGTIGGGCLSTPIAGGCGTIGGSCLSTPIAGGCGTIGGGCLSGIGRGIVSGPIGGGCLSRPIGGGCLTGGIRSPCVGGSLGITSGLVGSCTSGLVDGIC